ncbi:MAG: tetraacyldisaccharide 4'-kinase [Deltaproteobacteria bacterium RBG_13_52_11b]|nr:MAG: tetraacyldisaccharide 4'-kinase [Deltaproteobacteria bacterium RBG_13_52_11b]
MSRRLDRFLYRTRKSFLEKALLLPLTLLSVPYGWAVRIRTLLYDLGVTRSKRLPCPVISVGNITVGGTGKTPLVMTLANGLAKRGVRTAVLTRGYKGTKTSGHVASDGQSIFLSPEESGDEPYMMSKTLQGTPVVIGKNRFSAGEKALHQFGVDGLLLDDGFQHLQLHRDLNILLIDSNIGFGDRHLLPRGILREPLKQLRRASLILLTKVDHPEAPRPLEEELRRLHPSLPIFHSHYEPLGLIGPKEEREELHALQGKNVLAFSGIANPDSFSSLLKKCGMKVIKERVFSDHYHYTQEDIRSIEEKGGSVDWIVTTEKDMVKLTGLNMDRLPIRALHIEMRIWEEEQFFERVMGVFSPKGRERG